MGRASRRKRERPHRQRVLFGIDRYTPVEQMQLGEGMLNALKAASIIGNQSMREMRELNLERAFIEKISCQCRPPCGESVETRSMFNPSLTLTYTPCKRILRHHGEGRQ